jgi:hypothetical protein
MYVPQPYQIVQTADYVVFLFERMSWRIVSLDRRPHLPDHMRLWQGDSVGRWEGDTLVVDTTNLNGKTWLNEGGQVVSHAEHVVELCTGGSEHDQLRGDSHRSHCVHAAVDPFLSDQAAERRTARGRLPRGRPGPLTSEGDQGRSHQKVGVAAASTSTPLRQATQSIL